MVVLVNRAKMTTSTTGTGTITLGSVVDGYQTFAAAGVSNGDSVRYVIEDGTSNWEIGSGTYTASGTTLSRNPSESSDGGSAITLSGDAIVFISAIASDIQPITYVTTTFTATAAQTTFTVSYTAGLVEVFLNGAKLSGADFTATNGTSIVLASGANVGDTVDVIAYGTVSVANTYTQAQADALFVDVAGDTMTGALNVQGTVTADGLTVDGSAAFNLGAGEEVSIYRSTDYAVLRLGASSTDHWSFQEAGTNSLYLGSIDSGTAVNHIQLDNNGDISFYEDTGTTAKFFWDASAESLGIGTSSPDAALKIISPATGIPGAWVRADNYGLRVSAGSTSAHYALRVADSNDVTFATFNGDGNVGIGTSSPSDKLHVQSSGDTKLKVETTGTTAASGHSGLSLNTGNGGYLLQNLTTADSTHGVLRIYDTANSSERMRIESGGALLVTSNDIKSSISGTYYLNGANGTAANPNYVTYSFVDDVNTGMYLGGADTLNFATGGSEAMRIDSSGNLLVGTTDPLPNVNNVEGVAISSGSYGGFLAVSRDNATPMGINRKTSDGALLDFRKDGTTVGSIGSNNGNIKISAFGEEYAALSGTTPTVDCQSGNNFALSTTGNTTFTFSNPPTSGTAFGFTLKVTAGGTHTLTWPASVDWAGGTAPDAPASGETNVLVFITYDGGTTWYGFQAGAALA